MTDALQGLIPTHLLAASTEELMQKIETDAAALENPIDDKKQLMQERSYTFNFAFTDKRGKVFRGTFTSKIPDMKTRSMIGVLRAQLNGGVNFNALDPFTKEINYIIATLSFVLSETKEIPDWAKDLRAIADENILYALFKEVSAHQETFLG